MRYPVRSVWRRQTRAVRNRSRHEANSKNGGVSWMDENDRERGRISEWWAVGYDPGHTLYSDRSLARRDNYRATSEFVTMTRMGIMRTLEQYAKPPLKMVWQ